MSTTYPDGQPILFYLDEFANIGVIPIITSVVTTARSRRIGISLGLQGVEQLERNYGKENATTILNNLKTKLVFSGLTGDSAKYVSDLSGFTTIETKNYTQNSGQPGQDMITNLFSGNSVSKSGTRRELITPDEVRRMKEDTVLIIAHNKNPVYDKKNTYYNQDKYKKKL
jgi:type IV secretion system protein VirD4